MHRNPEETGYLMRAYDTHTKLGDSLQVMVEVVKVMTIIYLPLLTILHIKHIKVFLFTLIIISTLLY